MNNMEKQTLADVANGFSEEEKRFILMMFPENYLTDELERRQTIATKTLNDVCTVLQDIKTGMTLEEMRDMICHIKCIVKEN